MKQRHGGQTNVIGAAAADAGTAESSQLQDSGAPKAKPQASIGKAGGTNFNLEVSLSCVTILSISTEKKNLVQSFSPSRLNREGNGTPFQYSCLENPMDGGAWQAAVHGVMKSRTRLSDFPFTFHFHALEKEMATHSSVLAWRIPGTGEPSGLLSMGLHRVGHD